MHQVPPLWPGPSPAASGQLPALAPTEALRGRPGGPGLTAPPGAVPGLLDPEQRSSWQLAQQVWQASGVSWEPAAPDPAGPDSAGPAPVTPFRPAGPASLVLARPASGHPAWPSRAPGRARPAVTAAGFIDDGDDPADDWGTPTENWDTPVEEWGEPGRDGAERGADRAGRRDRDLDSEPDEADSEANEAQSGAVEAQSGAVDDPGAAGGRGDGWDEPTVAGFDAAGQQATGYYAAPHNAVRVGTARFPVTGGHSGPSRLAGGTGPVPLPPQAFAAMPLGAPVTLEQPAPWSAETARPARAASARPLSEPDALFRAWQGSVKQAADPRRRWSATRPGLTARPRHQAWRLVTIGVPAAVIVTVGAGALMMLTGRANEMLAVQGDAGTSASAASGTAPGGDAPGATRVTDVHLPGYPGQHGPVVADSVWSAGGVSLAVGDADGHPAIWRQSGGSWVLVSAAVLDAVPGTATLTAVAHGPAGWIAVGSASTGRSTSPLVLVSADGVIWQPVAALADVAGSDVEFLGVAAGSDGYAVVGRQMIGGRAFAVLWWSADLRMWVQGANGGLDGRVSASTAHAVAVTATGFAAVGSHGALAAIWTSPDGAHWNLRNVPAPSGARTATLRQIVASGNTIVAVGSAATGAGDIPLAVVSTDGGAHWQSVVLPASGGLGLVTALTTDGNRLVAAGQAGRAGAQRFVTWTSRDGLHWSAASAVAGIRQLSALSVSGGTLTGTGTGTARHGTGPSIMTFPAP